MIRQALKRCAAEPLLALIAGTILASIALFVVYPLLRVFSQSLQQHGVWSLHHYAELLARPLYRYALRNSLEVALVVGVVSVLIGYITAFVLLRTQVRFARSLHMLAILPVVSPPFVTAVSIVLLFGANGFVTRHILHLDNFSIYGFFGVVLSQVFTFAPIAYLVLRGVLKSISSTLEDASLNLGVSRWQTFLHVTLPLSLPGIASAFLVVFIESLGDFGNPLVLAGARFPMLATQAYLEITGSFNLPVGSALAIVLLVPSLTAFFIQRRFLSRHRYVTVTGKPDSARSRLVTPITRAALYLVVLLFSLFIVAFYAVILIGASTRVWGTDYTPTWGHFAYVFSVGFRAVRDTLVIAILSAPISGLLGTFIAFLVVRGALPGKRLLEFGSILNFAVPGTVVGIGYILAFNHPPVLLTGTLAILVIAFVFRYMPVGIQSSMAALRQIDPSIEEAARNLGASSLTTFRRVTLPLISPAFFSGLVYSFVRAMTAISAAIFLVSAHWNLMTVQILSQVGSGRLGVAAAFSVLVILIVIAAILVIHWGVARLTPTRTPTALDNAPIPA